MAMPSRYRTQGALAAQIGDVQTYVTNQNCANLARHLYSTGDSNLYVGQATYMYDEVIKDYHKRSAAGEVIFNPMVKSMTGCVGTNGTYTATAIPPHASPSCSNPLRYIAWELQGRVFAQAMFPYLGNAGFQKRAGAIDDRVSKLEAECWTACNAERQKGQANYLESLAEIEQAWHMCRNPLENVARFLDEFVKTTKFKKGQGLDFLTDTGRHQKRWRKRYKRVIRRGQLFLDFTSAEWLRFRYGIKPLMSDVAAALKALETAYNRKEMRYAARAKRHITLTEQEGGWINYDVIKLTWEQVRTRKIEIRSMILDAYVKTIWDDLGLNMPNLLGLAWELTRYSFVVDWFVNVGDLIYANVPRAGVTSFGGTISTKETWTTLTRPVSCEPLDPLKYIITGPTDSVYCYGEAKTRKLGSGDGGITINDNFRFGDSYQRCADAAALVLQRLSKITFPNVDRKDRMLFHRYQ